MALNKIYINLLIILSFIFVDLEGQHIDQNIDSKLSENKAVEISISSNAVRNQMWEEILFSDSIYLNPYKDIILSVQFVNSDSSIIYNEYGFWDGDSTFKIRSYFPEIGEWFWKTTCTNRSDSGLHNKTGTVLVSEYSGSNKIYKLGALKVSESKKYLTYQDGTPFFWMGGTAWALPFSSTYIEWQKYIDDRHSKKFNIVQVAPARSHGGIWEDPPYNYPSNWKGDICFFDEDKWNPLYWQEFDKFVEYANSKEIIVVIFGLAEPVHDDTELDDAELFTRNFYARMQGYHVILSPAFDLWHDYQYSMMDSVGTSLTTYSRHLISQHTGHSYADAPLNIYSQYFKSKNYIDFSMNQSGHNGGNLEKVYQKGREWNLNLYNEEPLLPVINTEAYYASGQYYDQIENPERQGTDENAREIGWLSILSGSLGYTYGATGIWQYGEETSPGLVIPLDSAISFNSSSQMEYLVDFFTSIDWWHLEPNQSAILNNDNLTEPLKMAFAISDSGKFGVAFLPNNDSIKIDMTIFNNSVSAIWFNPIDSIYIEGNLNVSNIGEYVFVPPSSGEWALLLKPLPDPPVITSYQPSEKLDVSLDQKIMIDFTIKMNKTSVQDAFSISPSVNGTFGWEQNDRRMIFTPDDYLNPNTTYTVTIDSTAKSYYDVSIKSEFVETFETRQSLQIVKTYPANDEEDISTTVKIKLKFNAGVDQYSLGGKISFEDVNNQTVELTISETDYENGWIIFEPLEELENNAVYQVKLYSGISDNEGTILSSDTTIVFTTEKEEEVSGTAMIDFEDITIWLQPEESGSTQGVDIDSASFSISSSKFVDGTHSGKLNYTFTSDSGGVCRIFYETEPKIPTDQNSKFGIWVFGDFSNNILEYWFRDKDSNNIPIFIDTLNFTGWKFKEVDLSSYGELAFHSIVVKQNVLGENYGVLYFDAMTANADVVVDVKEDNLLPTEFKLEQNYPNPFNPSTIISYSIPNVASDFSLRKVTLKIYDLLGREVHTLVNAKQNPGNYKVTFDAKNLSSGVYYYQLSAGDFIETKKMILLK